MLRLSFAFKADKVWRELQLHPLVAILDWFVCFLA